jgi:catechol 2,3-dioxygenase-like lactoylglutathione lyase family enzyme
MENPRVIQIAMCTDNITETIRRYLEVFEFADAGGDLLWGSWLGQMQEVGDDVSCVIWWLVGRQSFIQLEFFQHSVPTQAPLPRDWRPSDLGWVRWGMTVPNFDECVGRMRDAGIKTYTEPMALGGVRRVCFRDPDFGAVVEVVEEGPDAPGGVRPTDFSNAKPALLYAAVSVADLDASRAFFTATLGMREVAHDTLHDDDMDVLWGLEGSTSRHCVVEGGGVYLEIVQYDPVGRAPAPDRRLTDQGMMNAAVGYRQREHLDELVNTIENAGLTLNTPLGPPPAGTYIRSPEGVSMEILSVPQQSDGVIGFMPREVKIRP